jgi:putative transcriptional regulator
MTIDHHPNDELLLDYSSGAMVEGWSLAIATHLALCPECRQAVRDIEAIGASLMEGLFPTKLSADSSNAVVSRLSKDAGSTDNLSPKKAVNQLPPVLPNPLRRYAGEDFNDLQWRRLGLGAYQCLITTADKSISVRLLRIPAGKPVPTHTHGGLELTLVLRGAFSDATGRYGRGDLQEADETLEHQPHADAGEDCICLAVTDAPLRFSNLTARLVQPFIGI